MSLILDALKKSERQRSLGRDLVFRSTSTNGAPRLTGFAIAVLATLLVLVVALGAFLYNLSEPERSPLVKTDVETATPPSDSTTRTNKADSTTAPVPSVRPEMPALDSQAPARPQAIPHPKKPDRVRPVPSADLPRPTVETPSVKDTGAAPWLSSLPQSFRSSLPPLAVNIHVYSPEQSQRILYINNHPVQQGGRIEGGVVVEEIVHDGVVLQYRGQRFKLPRPS